MGGLKEWFKQDWVDIGSKKKGGGFNKCGRKSASGSKRKYPKCVPAAKAARMTESQRRSAVARKRAKPQGVGGKPTNVATFKRKKSVKKKMYMGGMAQTGTPDKNKIMGAGTMQQNPQQSLMEMNRNKVAGMKEGGIVAGIKGFKKEYAMGGGVRKVRY